MPGKWETEVGQLRLVGGNRLDDPANLGAIERRSLLPISRRGKGRLYVLIELSGGAFGREELCQDLVEAIADEYYHTPGTVTYGLRQAVLLANTHLLRANARASSEHRVGGVSCVVLRDGEAFIAQAGWPVVYLIHREQVRAFPDMTLEDEDTSTLGQRQTCEVRLFRTAIQSGDTVLMVDGPMSRQLGITRIGQVVSGTVDQAIVNLETLAPPEDCTAMVVQIGSAPYVEAETDQWTFTPVESPPASGPVSSRTAVPPPSAAASDAAVEEELARPVESPPSRSASEPTMGERAGVALGAIGASLRTLGAGLLPDRKPGQRARPRLRPMSSRQREQGRGTGQFRWGIAVALAVPVIVLIFVGGYILYRNWSLSNQFNTYLETAQLSRDMAMGSVDDPVEARKQWEAVLANVKEAEKLQPENAELPQLRAQAEVEIDRLDSVTRLERVHQLFDYEVPGSTPSKVIVAGLDVYVLDRIMGRVYHHRLNDLRTALTNPNAEQTLIQQGQSVEGQVVGSLVDIAWVQDGGERQAGAVLILDRNGLLLEYDPTWEQLKAQTVGGQETWRGPNTLRTFDSNLYLLDPAANQIFKYWADRYAEAPDRWLTQTDADVTDARDMGINGSIYVLHSDGEISKYYGGERETFKTVGVPIPLANGDALYYDVEEVVQHMYVADSLGGRIVQLDPEGVFVRQFRPLRGQEDTFGLLAGVFVDETGDKLYYVADNALYVADIPPLHR